MMMMEITFEECLKKRLTFYVSEKVHNKKIYYSIRHIYLDVFFFLFGENGSDKNDVTTEGQSFL